MKKKLIKNTFMPDYIRTKFDDYYTNIIPLLDARPIINLYI